MHGGHPGARGGPFGSASRGARRRPRGAKSALERREFSGGRWGRARGLAAPGDVAGCAPGPAFRAGQRETRRGGEGSSRTRRCPRGIIVWGARRRRHSTKERAAPSARRPTRAAGRAGHDISRRCACRFATSKTTTASVSWGSRTSCRAKRRSLQGHDHGSKADIENCLRVAARGHETLPASSLSQGGDCRDALERGRRC